MVMLALTWGGISPEKCVECSACMPCKRRGLQCLTMLVAGVISGGLIKQVHHLLLSQQVLCDHRITELHMVTCLLLPSTCLPQQSFDSIPKPGLVGAVTMSARLFSD